MSNQEHRAGYVNIIGHPNVGKSTLMNQLVGEQLSIISPKAQTTRHRILGIVNTDTTQVIYSDTPGIINPAYKLQEGMMNFVYSSFQDADILILMIENGQKDLKDEKLIAFIENTELPVLALINKVDLSDQEGVTAQIELWQSKLPKAKVVPISALHGFNLDAVSSFIDEHLPLHPPYYAKDELTDKSERFIVEEKVREKILLQYKQEIPYSVEVKCEQFKESDEIIRIMANIFVARDSQKAIIIGKGGQKIKYVGADARKDLEAFFGKKIYLELFVKINKDWRDNEQQLKRFGYL